MCGTKFWYETIFGDGCGIDPGHSGEYRAGGFPCLDHDSKGRFMVKSAYHVLKDDRDNKAKKQVRELSSGTNSNRLIS